jgi:hypothetical protein
MANKSDSSEDSLSEDHGDSSSEDYGVSVEKLYLEVPDVSHWADINKEICLRWQAENEFVQQLRHDPILQQVFEDAVNESTKYSEEMDKYILKYTDEMEPWFNSELSMIRRAFSNRFDMACELIREARRAEDIKKDDERMLAIKEELEVFSTTCALFEKFEQGDGVFGLFRNKTNTAKLEFIKWLAQTDENVSNATKTELKEQSSNDTSITPNDPIA